MEDWSNKWDKADSLAREVLNYSRNVLQVQFGFLDLALSSFTFTLNIHPRFEN